MSITTEQWRSDDSGVLFEEFSKELKRADSSAFGELWNRYFLPLLGLAESKVGRRQVQAKFDAEDVMQSVFMSFMSGLNAGRLRLDSSRSLRGLLMLMVTRKCARYIGRYSVGRRNVQLETSTLEDPMMDKIPANRMPGPDEALLFDEELASLISRFDQQDKQVIHALLEGQSTSQIAQHLGCSRRTIQRTVRRVTEALYSNLRPFSQSKDNA